VCVCVCVCVQFKFAFVHSWDVYEEEVITAVVNKGPLMCIVHGGGQGKYRYDLKGSDFRIV